MTARTAELDSATVERDAARWEVATLRDGISDLMRRLAAGAGDRYAYDYLDALLKF